MPRPNRPRSIHSEVNLAERIAFEREARGLSYETLAKSMTDAGCSITGSAIYRIEKGTPPRRVSVDELVALSDVLDVDIVELLVPLGLVRQQRALEITKAVNDDIARLHELVREQVRLWIEYGELAKTSPELGEYMQNHLKAFSPYPGGTFKVLPDEEFEFIDSQNRGRIEGASADLFNAIMKAAMDAAAGDA
jgi:transcriptional regulator with XRE-family HTH domain